MNPQIIGYRVVQGTSTCMLVVDNGTEIPMGLDHLAEINQINVLTNGDKPFPML